MAKIEDIRQIVLMDDLINQVKTLTETLRNMAKPGVEKEDRQEASLQPIIIHPEEEGGIVSQPLIDRIDALVDRLQTIISQKLDTEIRPNQFVKTVALTTAPEYLAVQDTFFKHAILIGNNSYRTSNTGNVYLGPTSPDGAQPYLIEPGKTYTIDAGDNEYQDFNDWYLDVENAGDGVVVIYTN